MPSFSEIFEEIQQSAVGRPGGPDFDGVRRRYLKRLVAKTGRPAILYYANWMNGARPDTAIAIGDMQGMMEVLRGISGPALDIVISSPGGSAEATESIVNYVRTKFDDVHVYVPLAAMSAATMLALSADRIVMGKHSQLGPIDPQITWPNAAGQLITMPARAIVDQFERAKTELVGEPKLLPAWLPLLQQYGPGLLQVCQTSEDLAKRLVQEWLARYMFRTDPDGTEKARTIAEYFGNAGVHQSHSLGIHRQAAKDAQLVVDDLETDQELQDCVLSVHHATVHTLNAGTLKIIENHLDKAYCTVPVAPQFPIQLLPQFPQVPPAAPPR